MGFALLTPRSECITKRIVEVKQSDETVTAALSETRLDFSNWNFLHLYCRLLAQALLYSDKIRWEMSNKQIQDMVSQAQGVDKMGLVRTAKMDWTQGIGKLNNTNIVTVWRQDNTILFFSTINNKLIKVSHFPQMIREVQASHGDVAFISFSQMKGKYISQGASNQLRIATRSNTRVFTM